MNYKLKIIGNKNIVIDSENKEVGQLSSESIDMIDWLLENNFFDLEAELSILKRVPVTRVGVMMYHIDDPLKEAYKWKTWDDTERILEDWDFINEEDKIYLFILNLPWIK